MGEIKKQSIRGTIFIYGGAILGFITSGIMFPRFLTTDQIGLVVVMVSYSAIFTQLASLGFVSATTRMFPYFRDSSGWHNGFLFLGILVAFVGFLIVAVVFYFIEPLVITNDNNKSDLLVQYSYLIYPLALFTILFNLHDHYNKVLFNASRGLFLKEFLLRIVIIIFILIFVFEYISFNRFLYFYVFSYTVPFLIISLLLLKDGQLSYIPRKGLIDKELVKPMMSVSFYGIVTSSSSILTVNIARVMVDSYLGLDDAGIYATCFFFGTLVIMPSRAILKISAAFITDSFKNRNLSMIKDIYHKTSITQFLIGSLLFIGILVNERNIFEILGYAFIPGKWVIVIIGLSHVIDMLSGASARIIENSEFYRKQGLFMIILIVLIIITNIIFIPLFGIIGAALASLISKTFFHIIKFIFILRKFNMQPYNFKFILVIIISIIAYLSGNLLPIIDNYILDIGIRSVLTGAIFISLCYILNISVDISESIEKISKKLFT